MEDDIKFIQNTLWAMYKEYQSTHDMKLYNRHAERLCEKYKCQPIIVNFCINLIISWAPIINALAEQYREDGVK